MLTRKRWAWLLHTCLLGGIFVVDIGIGVLKYLELSKAVSLVQESRVQQSTQLSSRTLIGLILLTVAAVLVFYVMLRKKTRQQFYDKDRSILRP